VSFRSSKSVTRTLFDPTTISNVDIFNEMDPSQFTPGFLSEDWNQLCWEAALESDGLDPLGMYPCTPIHNHRMYRLINQYHQIYFVKVPHSATSVHRRH